MSSPSKLSQPSPAASALEEEKQTTSSLPQPEPHATEGADPARDSEEEEESDEGDEEEEDAEEEETCQFDSDEAADAARQEGLKAYNEGRYDDALDIQYRIVRFLSSKYGSTAPECGTAFLDYGLSQLRLLQGQSSVEDALEPRDEDALETCYINLEVARVCLQKRDACEKTDLDIAEVHNALGQLFVEKEDYEAALKEYEAELLLYRTIQFDAEEAATEDKEEDGESVANGAAASLAAVPAGRIVSVLYSIADCYMKACDFDGAEERLQATLEEIAKYPDGTIAAELKAELDDLLEDARDMKGGKFKDIQDEIQKQYAEQEEEKMPTAQEFYALDADGKHPFLSSIPGGGMLNEGSHLSMPTSASGQVLGSHMNPIGEHSNSQSMSIFPPQSIGRLDSASRSNTNGPVHQVAARKKPKQNAPSVSQGESCEPEAKKARTE